MSGAMNFLEINRPDGEIKFHNSKVYDRIPCETRLRGLCVCRNCPKDDCCIDITVDKTAFKDNPRIYWQMKVAEIIDDVYTFVVFYEESGRVVVDDMPGRIGGTAPGTEGKNGATVSL